MKLRKILFILLGIGILVLLVVFYLIFFKPKPPANNPIKQNTTKQAAYRPNISNKIKEEIKVTYYDIQGNTKDELFDQMSKLGPPEGETHYFARTNWAINWTYPIPVNEKYEPVEVVASIEYILPRWTNEKQASSYLRQKWNEYLKKIKSHEEKHKDITIIFCKKFLAKIKKLKYKDYKELEEKIGQLHATGEFLIGCTKAQERFDKKTNHGINDGVVW